MQDREKLEKLSGLFKRHSGQSVDAIEEVGPHGSEREIVRLSAGTATAIGIYDPDPREFAAFLHFSEVFLRHGLPVPRVYAYDLEAQLCLVEDLGRETLFDLFVQLVKPGAAFPERVTELLRSSLRHLLQMQVNGGRNIDYSKCWRSREYDRESMLWDMHYFRDSFLTRTTVKFDPQLLEQDFSEFARFLSEAPADYFMHRDYQSRNLMVRGNEVAIIDYQRGRKGALHYDLVTLLFQSRFPIPDAVRDTLLSEYLLQLEHLQDIDKAKFHTHLTGFLYVQFLHRLGAYGKLGLEQGRVYFIESIGPALENLRDYLQRRRLSIVLPELSAVFEQLAQQGSGCIRRPD